jgi:major membrane immunogen (membrane-anchored lipoprotein)
VKRVLAVAVSIFLVMGLLGGCGSAKVTYKDGTYEAKSDPDKEGNSGTIKITVSGAKITAVEWKEYYNGALKDENYGKESGDKVYAIAQKARKGSSTYPNKLIEVQNPEKVDAVSGATQSNELFKKLAQQALKDAKS